MCKGNFGTVNKALLKEDNGHEFLVAVKTLTDEGGRKELLQVSFSLNDSC